MNLLTISNRITDNWSLKKAIGCFKMVIILFIIIVFTILHITWIYYLGYERVWFYGCYSLIDSYFQSIKLPILGLVAIIGTLLGVSLPIYLSILSRLSEQYDDGEIKEVFLKEKYYIIQLKFVIPLIGIIALMHLWKERHWIIEVICFLLLTMCIYFFYMFIKTIQIYSTNFENYYLEKLQNEIEDILH
ncbi:hypothetical protein WJR50_00765 [Catalinimonas sp. 4WD22]|uniref:hypothetical protein n=1 Tax=Catalinimonas locisalis TaxID=3133978 RepID=UPI0031010941